MSFLNEELKIFREQIPMNMNSRIATLVMLTMFIFAIASPSISVLENMAMAQNSNQANQVDQGAQKQGAVIQNAPSNPLIFGIDNGTSSSASPNTPRQIPGNISIAQLPTVQAAAPPERAIDVEATIENITGSALVPDEQLLRSEKERASRELAPNQVNNQVNVSSAEVVNPFANETVTSSNNTVTFSPQSSLNNQSSLQAPGAETVVQYSSFPGISYSQSGGWYPPDPTVAVGPTYVLEMVNNAGAVYDKAGNLIVLFATQDFFGTGENFVFDPVVLYDSDSGRYFAMISDGTANQVRMFVSDTDNPLSSWHGYWMAFDKFPDQLRAGTSTDTIAIIVSDFGSSGFTHEEVYFFGKPDVVSGGDFRWVHWDVNPEYFHIQPTIAMTSSSGADVWWVYSPWNGGNFAIIFNTRCNWGASNCFVDSFYNIPIAPTAIPPGAEQAGSTNLVNTNDARIGSAAIMGNTILWTQNDRCIPGGDSSPRSCIRWNVVTTGGYLLQDMDIGVAGKHLYFGATAADRTVQFGVTFGLSSSTDFPSVAFSGQSRSSPYNTIDGILIIAPGTSPETTDRHGDYASLSVDFTDRDLPYWGVQEDQTTELWNTHIFSAGVY
jgi:hypothetical protein